MIKLIYYEKILFETIAIMSYSSGLIKPIKHTTDNFYPTYLLLQSLMDSVIQENPGGIQYKLGIIQNESEIIKKYEK